MAELPLSDIFPGSTQNEISITIPKAALATLVAKKGNRGDSIIAAMLITLKDFYTQERRDANPDASIVANLGRVGVDTNFDSGLNYVIRPIEFSLYSELSLPELDAESY